MSDETLSADDAPADADLPNMFDTEGDWFLAYLVGWANQFGIEMGMTLTVGGKVVTGLTISGADYFKAFAATAGMGVKQHELKETIESALAAWAQIYEPVEGQAADAPTSPPGYIHLKNARYIVENGSPQPVEGMLWRGRIASVDGFSLGTFSANR